MKAPICALVSGGLDSCVMVAELAKTYRRVFPVFIRQGLAWETVELRHLRRYLDALVAAKRLRGILGASRKSFAATIQPLTILDLPATDLYGAHWSTTGQKVPGLKSPDEEMYLPGRNLMLLSKAAVFCALHKIPVIAVGSLGHNPFPDATPAFFRDFARVAGTALNCRLRVIAPFRSLTKEQVIRLGCDLPLHLTFSCVAPQHGRACGSCNKCAERQRAFREIDLSSRTNFMTKRSSK